MLLITKTIPRLNFQDNKHSDDFIPGLMEPEMTSTPSKRQDVVRYSRRFAIWQAWRYLGGCSWCHTEGYLMMRCDKCQAACYCREECQRKHKDTHKVACKRIYLFNFAKSRIPQTFKDEIYHKLGYVGMSCYLGLLPIGFRYRVLGGKYVIILQILEVARCTHPPFYMLIKTQDILGGQAHIHVILKNRGEIKALNLVMFYAKFVLLMDAPDVQVSPSNNELDIFIKDIRHMTFIGKTKSSDVNKKADSGVKRK
ncbi:uncharacterized protein LOC131944939 isoform X2 [Physella acuta]|uniref:uncharacterized protein LOC131944939 isoform X2 n=1 Tax=Physella acuta TaxID=109671 RepID=UPI0027DAEF9C|nr:uncharacterized protein LOC131944939 isoform X2 [Physella acuta]